MDDDLNPEIPDDASELEFLKQEQDLANEIDEGIDLYHSISKGQAVNKNFHAGTYNAALDRASQFYGGEQLYKVADNNLINLQDEVNDLITELSETVNFEKIDNVYEITENSVTREVSATLQTGFVEDEVRFNIVAETFDNRLIVKFQDLDGYDGAEIYSEELIDIDYKPDNLKTFVGDIEIIGDKKIADGLLDEIGIKSQAGEFNYKDGYDLYKVKIKPNANVVNIPDTATFIENGIKKSISADFIQGFIERPSKINEFSGISQIIIDGKTYDITDDFTPSQALQEHFKGADVLVYTNDIEDVGSKSYMFLNENSYVLQKVNDTQFNIDVANKYIKNNPYETISTIGRQEAFLDPERYQVLLNAILDEADTPITTEPALLETRFKYEFTQVPDESPRGYSVIKDKPQWQYDVVKPNKIFHPNKMQSAFNSLSKDAKEIIDAYVKGTMTDKQATRLFIFLASHSDLPAWGFGKSYSARDAIGDIAKIGIMSDRPLNKVLPMGIPFSEKEFLNKIQMRTSDFFQAFDANAIKSEELALRMLVDMTQEQGQFTNFKERMRQVLIDEHNKIYNQNPNDYFILWRGGNLNRFNTWQSFSKRLEAATGVMQQVKMQGAGQGGKVNTYVLNKNNFIDLDALGLSHGNEQEVIVLTEAANKTGAKIPDGLDDAKQIEAYVDSWAIRANEPEFYPKKGFAITNISQQLNQLGQGTQQFFTDVIQGMGDQAPQKAYEQLIDFNNKELDTAQDIYNKFIVQGGDFNQHIFTSIPTFYEAQIVKGVALSNMLNNFEKVNVTTESPKIKVLDIGATEGTWSKLLGSLNNNLEIDVLEPNPAAKEIFEESDQVDNVFFRQNAFSYLPEDQGKYFMEEGGKRNINFFNFGAGELVQFRYDVVHESMTFQFLDSNRKAQINFIADNVLNDNGIFIIEEKFSGDDAVGQYNEKLKNDWKSQYYTPEQLDSKQNKVLTEMGRNQVSRLEIETILNSKFKYVNQYWSSGNFAGFIASNNPLADTFVDEINSLDVSLTNHEFSTNPTEEEIKYAVKKQVEGTGINPDLHKAVVADMVDKNAGFINKVTDGLLGVYKGARSVGLAALGLGLKGLSKAAPVLEPGDVLIEKALQKATPQIGKYASRLGFGFLPIKNVVSNYIALEIGMAAAEFMSAAMYAYNDYAKAQKGGYLYEYQNIDGKTRYVPVRQEDGTPVYQPALNTYDFFNTPLGQEAIKDFNYNDFFLKELEKERVSQYSPGWSLSKAIFGLFGTMVDEQAKISEQTRGDVGQALLTGIGK